MLRANTPHQNPKQSIAFGNSHLDKCYILTYDRFELISASKLIYFVFLQKIWSKLPLL